MPDLSIKQIVVGKRFRKELGDVAGLAESMSAIGLLHPVVVTEKNKLVSGARRLAAAVQLGWKKIPARVVNLRDLLRAEHDENEVRKDFAPSERHAIAAAIEETVEERRGRPGRNGKKVGNGPHYPTGEKTREVAARKAGFDSDREYRRVGAVVANGSPELVEAMDRGDVSASAAATLAGLHKEEQREVLSNGAAAATVKAKEIREHQVRCREAEKSKYAHSDRLYRWLRVVASDMEVIQIEMGGIKQLLAEPAKWDWQAVHEYILPIMESVQESLTEFHREVQRHARQQAKA